MAATVSAATIDAGINEDLRALQSQVQPDGDHLRGLKARVDGCLLLLNTMTAMRVVHKKWNVEIW